MWSQQPKETSEFNFPKRGRFRCVDCINNLSVSNSLDALEFRFHVSLNLIKTKVQIASELFELNLYRNSNQIPKKLRLKSANPINKKACKSRD